MICTNCDKTNFIDDGILSLCPECDEALAIRGPEPEQYGGQPRCETICGTAASAGARPPYMNGVDTFKCLRLKKTFTVGRCVRNQKDALDFWGPNASKFQSCPCDQGIEIRQQMEENMAAKAICKNCGREMKITQEGLCGGCFYRIRGMTGEAKVHALAQARKDFKGRGPVGPGNRKPITKVSTPISARKPDPEPPPPDLADRPATTQEKELVFTPGERRVFASDRPTTEIVSVGSALESSTSATWPPPPPVGLVLSVIVYFTDGDSAIFEGLQALARKYRRNPDQQILWLLEKELLNESLLNTEKAVDHAA